MVRRSQHTVFHLSSHVRRTYRILVTIVFYFSWTLAMSNLDDIRQYFAAELSRVEVAKELFDCPDVPPNVNCTIPQMSGICPDDQVCRGAGMERFSRCCFDGCRMTCMSPQVVDWVSSPLRDREPGIIVAGPEAPDLGELCSLRVDAEVTLQCPHGFVCKEIDDSDARTPSLAGEQNSVPDWGICVNKGSVCQLPADMGRCKGSVTRYIYKSETNTCEDFIYSGCGGNDNNFKTVEQCRNACQKSDVLLSEQTDKDLFRAEPTASLKHVIEYEDPCTFIDCNVAIGQKCVLVPSNKNKDDVLPQCTCNYPCPVRVDPVCASNGHQFENRCLMEKHMCHENMTLSVVYYGQCNDPCMGVHCERGQRCMPDYERGTATCECTLFCPDSHGSDQVCGSNGKWYPSRCWLDLASCQLNTSISVVHRDRNEFCGNLKPGSCPVILSEPAGVCEDSCSLDVQCPNSQKCCFIGCGHRCVETVFDKDCSYRGHSYKNLATFSEGCSECSCKKGVVECSFINCIPDKNLYYSGTSGDDPTPGAYSDDDDDDDVESAVIN